VLYKHHTQSEGGATKITGFLQIYARDSGNCLWTCSAAALLAISSGFSLDLPDRERRSRDETKSRWSATSSRSCSLDEHLFSPTSSKFSDIHLDKRTASLLVIGDDHLFVILGHKAQHGATPRSDQQDNSDFASALTILCFVPSTDQGFGRQIAVNDGRVAFVAGASTPGVTEHLTCTQL
jgi:hypothetical protein